MGDPPIRPSRLTFAIGVTQILGWAATYYLPAVVTNAAAESLGASRTTLLGGFSAALIVAALCAPAVGRRIERLGGRGVLVGGNIVTALGLAMMGLAQGLILWYAAWAIVGVGMALSLYDAAFATIGRLIGHAARPVIVGVTLIAGFASTIGWPGGTWLVLHVGWRATVGLYALIELAVIVPILLIFVPRAGPAVVPAPVAGQHHVAAGWPFVLLAIFFTVRAAITTVVSVHAIVLLTGFHLDVKDAAWVAAAFGPAQVASRLLEWRLGRGLSPFASAALGAALLPLGIAALLGGLPPLLFAIGYGMSNGVLTISRGVLPMHLFGPAGYATVVGRLAFPSLLAQALAPTLAAPLVAAWPAGWMFAAIGAASVVALLALLALWPVSARAGSATGTA